MAQTKPKAGQFYGVSDNGTDGQFLKTDGTGGMSWDSPITNPTITSIDYPGTQTAADPAGGESVIINGTLFASGITCTVGGTSAVTAFNSATQITITTPAKAAGPYTVAVTNSDGGTASQVNFIQYSGVPVWSTAAGSLGSVQEGEAASFQVTATEGSDTIEYAVTTGTLPTGLSLATATGAITGTAPAVSADTTTTFSITATDDENQTSSERSFSITVQNDNPSNYFNTVLYTGNNGTQSITGVGFQPDFTWIKARDNGSNNHALTDSVRGTGSGNGLSSNTSGAEGQYSAAYGYLSAFGTDGFTVQAGSTSANFVNSSSANYVAWNFKAGGTAVTNTDGTLNSQVSANTTLGFSIVSLDKPNSNTDTYGHGLSSAPEMIILKRTASADDWYVYHKDLGNTVRISLNSNAAKVTGTGVWGSTTPTNSVFTLQNQSGGAHIAYCFTSKPGFSKVSSYTGENSLNGPIITTGFEPAFIMLKNTTGAYEWVIYDNKRSTSNPRDNVLYPNTSGAENSGETGDIDFLANGFKIKAQSGSINQNGATIMYLAFAADPSTTTPSLANSFATEIYTGNGGTQSITGTGFKPDFSWVKNRNTAGNNHSLADSVRGVNNIIYSNLTNAQYFNSTYQFNSFNADGITVTDDTNGNYGVNGNGETYVSWNWKAGGTSSINSDGSITSIVSANQAAGFSVVSYSGNSTSGATVGHGLNSAPEMVIYKRTDVAANWIIKSSILGVDNYLTFTSDQSYPDSGVFWNSTLPNSSVFTLGSNASVNVGNYIAYNFTSISGYSKVGSYSGTGAAQTITTGFQPGFLMVKATSHTSSWYIVDSARTPNYFLSPNSSAVEYTDSGKITFTSNGFTLDSSSYNNSGYTWIYLAIKEN